MDPDAHIYGNPAMSGHGPLDALLVTGPFHAALRAAIRERGLSLERLRSHLARRGIHIAVSSLSFWQHGHTVPRRRDSVRAVRALEEILQLPSGSLLKLLADAQAGYGATATAVWGGAVDELLDGLPAPGRHDVDVVGRHERLVIDADGCLADMWIRTALRARTDGVDRYVVQCFGDHDADGVGVASLHPVANCRLGQVRRHPTAPILFAEMLFDETLRAGQTWVFDFELVDEGRERYEDFAHSFNHPVGHYLVEVRFDPAALPVDCYTYARSSLHGERRRMETLRPNRYHTVHHMASNVTSGVLGIAWTWADAAPGEHPE